MNVADSDQLIGLLAEHGYSLSLNAIQSDLIVVNTCSVRARAENRAKTRLALYARNKKPGQKLWVIGCMAQRLGKNLMNEIPGIDQVIGAQSLEFIAEKLNEYLIHSSHSRDAANNQAVNASVFLPIMRGCDNYCAYCVVPYVRGREHSLPLNTILEKASQMVESGARELVLLGQNVNSYNHSSLDFADLLKAIHTIKKLERIRFTTSHPKDISQKLIHSVADLPKVCHHIHLPVQSGSSKILNKMNRKYARENYLETIAYIKKIIPEVDITTDVMVGFPGETDDDFNQTLTLFEAINYTHAFMFAFSPRSGTKAAKMPDQVPELVKKERLKTLIDKQTEITKSHYHNMIDKTVDVLFTQQQERKTRAWMGQDYGCKRVLLNDQENLIAKQLKVKIIKSTGMTLIGQKVPKRKNI